MTGEVLRPETADAVAGNDADTALRPFGMFTLAWVGVPIVVLGLPRTGTTLLSHLLDLDPSARSLLSWEASEPVPPPGRMSWVYEPV